MEMFKRCVQHKEASLVATSAGQQFESSFHIVTKHNCTNFRMSGVRISLQIMLQKCIEAHFSFILPLEDSTSGIVDDVDATLEQFRAAMESAGIRDILAEMESQAAAYVAN